MCIRDSGVASLHADRCALCWSSCGCAVHVRVDAVSRGSARRPSRLSVSGPDRDTVYCKNHAAHTALTHSHTR
eukprot:3040899-Prymnesium_polylepis.1